MKAIGALLKLAFVIGALVGIFYVLVSADEDRQMMERVRGYSGAGIGRSGLGQGLGGVTSGALGVLGAR